MAEAAELLVHLEKVGSDSAKGPACKRIGKLAFDEEDTPSNVYNKASLYKSLKCETLSGVNKEIDELLQKLVEGDSLESYDISEVYHAYLLGKENGASQSIEKRLVPIAQENWLPNFSPSKWTLKQSKTEIDNEGDTIEKIVERNLDPQVLQVAEMLASLIPNKKINKKAKQALDVAIPTLITKAVPETSAFFISKSVLENDALELTYNAMKAFKQY